MHTLIFLYPYLTVSSIQIMAAVAVHVSMIGLEIAQYLVIGVQSGSITQICGYFFGYYVIFLMNMIIYY